MEKRMYKKMQAVLDGGASQQQLRELIAVDLMKTVQSGISGVALGKIANRIAAVLNDITGTGDKALPLQTYPRLHAQAGQSIAVWDNQEKCRQYIQKSVQSYNAKQ